MSLATAQYEFRGNQSVATASHGSDRNLFVEFFWDAVELKARSREEGRPIFEDRIHVKIMTPEGKSTVVREAKLERDPNDVSGEPLDNERFPAQWAQFQKEEAQVGEGTPLKEWVYLSKSQVMELGAQNIHTVDQLAALPDSAISTMGLGAHDLRNRAQAYLEQAKGSENISKLMKQLEDQRHEIDALKAQLQSMGDKPAEAKRKPGRPPKES